MSLERTLSIIKPDLVKKNVIGKVLQRFEDQDLSVVAMKLVHLTEEEAKKFYIVHKDRPFYGELVDFIISGPVVISVLEGEDAVKKNRNIMGATNPVEAAPGTIRRDFCTSIEANGAHGSDSLENAKIEIAFFFKESNIHSRATALR